MKYLVFLVFLIVSSCGKSTQEYAQIGMSLSDIYGGSPVAEGKWKNVVAFTHLNSDNQLEKSFCSGTLINPSQVLTAAHCLKHYIKGNYQDIIVTIDNYGSSNPNYRNIESIKLHPFYHIVNENSPYDFALVSLQAPFMNIEIVPPAQTDFITQKKEVILVGFGDTDTRLRGIKHEVATNVQDTNELEFVAGGEGKDTCGGDSGGPVFAKNAKGVYELVGVTSRSSDDAQSYCGDKTIYGKVHLALLWSQAEILLEKSYNLDAFSALKLIEEALSLLKGFPDALMAKALALKEIWRFDESLEVLNQIIEKDPENIKAHIHIAKIYQKLEKTEQELAALKKILVLDPADAIAYNRLIALKQIDLANIYQGIGYFRQNKIEEAKKNLQLYSENSEAQFIFAFMMVRDGIMLPALKILQSLSFVDPFILNLKDKQGDNFLLSVAYNGHVELAKKLISLGADIKVRDEYGNNPTHLAWWRKNIDVLEILLSHNAPWDIDRNYTQFLHFISTENVEMVAFLLKHKIEVGCDALELVSKSENEEIKDLFSKIVKDCAENYISSINEPNI